MNICDRCDVAHAALQTANRWRARARMTLDVGDVQTADCWTSYVIGVITAIDAAVNSAHDPHTPTKKDIAS